MRISEVTDRTGIPARLLRYYEEQELLVPARNASGYRDYSDQDVEVARRIRQLLDAGLSTATIRTVLPCLIERAGRLAPICDETINDLKREQARIEASIETLKASRDAISSVIAAGRDKGDGDGGSGGSGGSGGDSGGDGGVGNDGGGDGGDGSFSA